MNTKLTPIEEQALGTIDHKTLVRLKEQGFTIESAGAQTAHLTADPWKLAFDPVYSDTAETIAYAGYIFRERDEHNECMHIPDEHEAKQIAAWLNERDQVLALCRDLRAALDTIKGLDPMPSFAEEVLMLN